MNPALNPIPLSSPPLRGVLLFAHGARDPRWAEPFEAVRQQLQARAPGTPLVLAFLEFMVPPLAEAGAQLAAAGCDEVEVVPLFLGAGGHVRKDLPQLLAQLREQHPAVQWTLRPAIGEMPSVIQAMAEAALHWLPTTITTPTATTTAPATEPGTPAA